MSLIALTQRASHRFFMSGPGSRLYGQAGLSLAIRLSRFAMGLVTAMLFARMMPPAQYGIYSYALTIITLLGIPVEAGLPQLLIREISRARSQKALEQVRGVVRFSARILFGFMGATALIALAVIAVIHQKLPQGALVMAAIALPAVALAGMGSIRGAILRGLGSALASQVPEQIVRPGALILIGGVAFLLSRGHVDAVAALSMTVAANAIAFVVGAALLARTYNREIGPGPSKANNKQLFSALLPFTALAAVQIASGHIALFIAGFYIPPAEIGQFRIAVLCSDVVSFPAFALNTLLAPRFSTLFHTGDMAGLRQIARTSARLCFVMSLALSLPFLLFADHVVRLGFGHAYVDAAPAVRLLVAGQLAAAALGSVATLANMAGFEKQTLFTVSLGLVLSCVLTVILAPRYGVTGAIIGVVTNLMVWKTLLTVLVRRSIGVSATVF